MWVHVGMCHGTGGTGGTHGTGATVEYRRGGMCSTTTISALVSYST